MLKAQEQLGETELNQGATLPCLGKGGKKGDIYRLGVIILSLALGKIVCEHVINIPTHLSASLRDFISKCLDSDERARWSAEQLSQHDFIKIPPVCKPTIKELALFQDNDKCEYNHTEKLKDTGKRRIAFCVFFWQVT